MRHVARLSLLSVLLVSSAAAQFTVTGRVEKIDSPTCSPKATHKVGCTNIYLFAADSTVDLKSFEGKIAEMTASLELALCPTYKVATVKASRYSFAVSPVGNGSYRIGERFRWRTTSPFLAIVPMLMAAGSGFIPVLQYGTFQLDLLTTMWLRNDVALFGSVSHNMEIPNERSLIGCVVYGQGAYFTLLPTLDVKLLNADCFTVKATK